MTSEREVVFRVQFHTGAVQGYNLMFEKEDMETANKGKKQANPRADLKMLLIIKNISTLRRICKAQLELNLDMPLLDQSFVSSSMLKLLRELQT